MSNDYIVKATKKLLSGLSSEDAASVINQVIEEMDLHMPQLVQNHSEFANAYRQKRRSKLDTDWELRTFVLDLPYLPLSEIVAKCEERFGKKRAPSISAGHRFMQAQRVR